MFNIQNVFYSPDDVYQDGGNPLLPSESEGGNPLRPIGDQDNRPLQKLNLVSALKHLLNAYGGETDSNNAVDIIEELALLIEGTNSDVEMESVVPVVDEQAEVPGN